MKFIKSIKLFVLPLFVLSLLFLIGCGDDDDDDNVTNGILTTADISGTLTLPSVVIGNTYVVLVDTDIDGGNGEVAITTGTCDNSTSVDYSINNVPSGTYFVYAAVYVVSSSGEPQTGDYFGYYDTGLTPPGSANATVPTSGSVTFDITLSVIP